MLVNVHQEAEEDGVHGHAINREEDGGYGVGTQGDENHRDQVVVVHMYIC